MGQSIIAVVSLTAESTVSIAHGFRQASLLVGMFLMVAAIFRAAAAHASPNTDSVSIMRLTVDSWLASQTPTGFFPYGFDFLADRPLEPDSMSAANLVRQTFAAYSLAEYYRYSRDPRMQPPLQRALSAFTGHSMPIAKSTAQRWVEGTRVLSLPFARWKLRSTLDQLGLLHKAAGSGRTLSPDGDYGHAATGAVALALLTELAYSRASGDERFAQWRAGWRDGLLALRVPGGGFRETPASIDEADYYNGEGWLALAVYSDVYHDDALAAGALAQLDEAMLARYSGKPSARFYHWGAMAAAQRLRTTADRRFASFLESQAALFLDRFERDADERANNCAEMEGLASALAVVDGSSEGDATLARRIRAWLSDEVAKLPKLQIQPGQQGLVLGGDARLHAPRMAEFTGAFLAGLYEPSTRIDHSAHCLSAMVIIERGRSPAAVK